MCQREEQAVPDGRRSTLHEGCPAATMLLAPQEKAQLQAKHAALRSLEADFFGGRTARQVARAWKVEQAPPAPESRAPPRETHEAKARRAKALARLGIASTRGAHETRLTLWPGYRALEDGDVLCTIQRPSSNWRSVARAEYFRRRLLLRARALAVCGLELRSLRVQLVEPTHARGARMELHEGRVHATGPTPGAPPQDCVVVQAGGRFGAHLHVDRLDGPNVGDALCGWLASRGAPLDGIDEAALDALEAEAEVRTRRRDARQVWRAIQCVCGTRTEVPLAEVTEAFATTDDALDPFKAPFALDVFGGAATVSLAQLKRGLHRLLKCRARGVGLEPAPADDDADVDAYADDYADDAFDEDPAAKAS